MSEFRIDQIKSQDATRGPDVAGITTFTGSSGIVMPSGDTAYRGGRGRGVFLSGTTTAIPVATNVNTIDYVTIATLGNAIDFGDTTAVGNEQKGGCASSTRGVYHTTSSNTLEYITISSTGNAFDFGDIIYGGDTSVRQTQLCSNSTRGLIAAGYSTTNTIEYITIATTGNAQDFGDLLTAAFGSGGSVASPTRAVHFLSNAPGITNIMEYNTISTLGNAKDFGDLGTTDPRKRNGGTCSNSVRGLFAGGGYSPSPAGTKNIDYITISSLGDSVEFGDLNKTSNYRLSGASSSTRGIFGGGETLGAAPSGFTTNVIDYVTIATTGDALDYGDLTQARGAGSSLSDVHGGLG